MAASSGSSRYVLERSCVGAEAGEDHALVRRHAQPGQTMLLGIEVGGIAAHARHAAAVGHADQLAARVVGPLVIDASVLAGVAARLALHRGAAMGAAVDEGVQAAVLGAADDDRRVAHERGLEVAGLRQLGLERDVVPDGPAEDRLLLAGEHVGPREQLERHAAAVARRSCERGRRDCGGFTRHRHPPSLGCPRIDQQPRAGCFAAQCSRLDALRRKSGRNCLLPQARPRRWQQSLPPTAMAAWPLAAGTNGRRATGKLMTAIRVAGLRKLFGGVPAVDDVSFEVESGSILTLLGPERLRQDHDAAHDRGAGAARRRRGARRRPGRDLGRAGHPPAARQAADGHGVPVLRHLAAHERLREHCLPAARPRRGGPGRRRSATRS